MATSTKDVVIIGGGPAGLSAAVYLGRFLRDTLVIDAETGRSTGMQRNDNYLGFPRGVPVRTLRRLGRKQAERFGVAFQHGTVASITRERDGFHLGGDCGEWIARAVILATGVTDIWPALPGVQRFIGTSLFWCITCDGFRTRGKRTLLIGATDEAAVTACQFLRYTTKLTFADVSVGDGSHISEEKRELLRENKINLTDAALERLIGSGGALRAAVIGGTRQEFDLAFSLLGSVPNTALAAQLGVVLDETGYVCIDSEQHTNVPCFYAAGDITGAHAHQVSTAVHEGAMAAQAANYDLYEPFQKAE